MNLIEINLSYCHNVLMVYVNCSKQPSLLNFISSNYPHLFWFYIPTQDYQKV